ncbi:hypothetical protein ACSLVV_08555 [Pseudomonas aeruginosa]|uniref:hypothetical protein n=1 Tax=Pseudomonas aeruginosa TaxID=287 RepID=UPI003F1CDC86
MSRKQSSAFVTTRKGFCYLTVKVGRSNYNIMRIRNYTLEPQDRTRTVYASDTCDSMALLDAVLHMERSRKK